MSCHAGIGAKNGSARAKLIHVNEERCIFCAQRGPMTAEHAMSKRVLDLAGFTLDDVSLEITIPIRELTVEYVDEHSKTIRDEFHRCVCARCNNGWMQNLDHSFAGTIERWATNPSHRLGDLGHGVICRYLAKVMWVKLLGEQWSRGPIQDGELVSHVILNPRHGDEIRTGQIEALATHLSVGAARVESHTIFTSAGFTPRLAVVGERSGFRRLSAGLVLALPALEVQLWLVYRFQSGWGITWPRSISWLHPTTRYENLSLAPVQPDIDAVTLS